MIGLGLKMVLWLANARKWLAAAIGWVVESLTHILIVVVAVLALVVLWQTHLITTRDRAITRLNLAAKQWRADLVSQQASYAKVEAGLAAQNAAVTAIGADSARRVAASDAALGGALFRAARRDTVAAQIADSRNVSGPVPNSPDCRTPDAVLAARGDL